MKLLTVIALVPEDTPIHRLQAVMTLKDFASRMSEDPEDVTKLVLIDVPPECGKKFVLMPVPYAETDSEKVMFMHALRYLGNHSPDDLHETNFSIYLDDGAMFTARLTKVKGARIPRAKD